VGYAASQLDFAVLEKQAGDRTLAEVGDSPGATMVALPIVKFMGYDNVCTAAISVQNIGTNPSRALLVQWGEMGQCYGDCAGPMEITCTGLIAPGGSWLLLDQELVWGVQSAMLFSFSAEAGDQVCFALADRLKGDCAAYNLFREAYATGGAFDGIPLGEAKGAPLAASVMRECPADTTAGLQASSAYQAVGGHEFDVRDAMEGVFTGLVAPTWSDYAGFHSFVYVQNAGSECASADVWFHQLDACDRGLKCMTVSIPPGETLPVNLGECTSPNMAGSLWVESTQPVAVVADSYGLDAMTTVSGATGASASGAAGGGIIAGPSTVAYGPLMYLPQDGWDTAVYVLNMDPLRIGRAKVEFLDGAGNSILELEDRLCPRGSQVFFLPVTDAARGTGVGSIRVESLPQPGQDPVPIEARAVLMEYSDSSRRKVLSAAGYDLVPEWQSFDWPSGNGASVVGVPGMIRDLDNLGLMSELAIQNVVPAYGHTDVEVEFYDRNGLVYQTERRLNEREVAYIDLSAEAGVPRGYMGSAVVRAVYWDHEDPITYRNLVGLAATGVVRHHTRRGNDVAGDELSVATGVPLGRSVARPGVVYLPILRRD